MYLSPIHTTGLYRKVEVLKVFLWLRVSGTHFCEGERGLTSKIKVERWVIMGVFQYSIKELATYLQWIQNIYFDLITFQNCCKSKPVISCKKSKAARVACVHERAFLRHYGLARRLHHPSPSVDPVFARQAGEKFFARTRTLA